MNFGKSSASALRGRFDALLKRLTGRRAGAADDGASPPVPLGADPLPRFIREAKPLRFDEPPALELEPAPPRRTIEDDEFAARLKRDYPAEPVPRKIRSLPFRIARFTLYWGAITAVWFAVVLASAVTVYSLFAEDPLKAGLSKQAAKITILSDDKKVIAEKGLRRSHVKLDDMPKHLIDAVLTTEDRRFYYHYGFDPLGIARAVFINRRAGRVVQGGSTITQQLVKVLFLKPDRTYWRKVEEALLSLSLEWRLDKKQILELYLNRIYFGAGNYGVEAAAQHYFGHSVTKITPYESAMLAGLIKSPTYFAPTTDFNRSLERGKLVLTNMHDGGDISDAVYRQSLAEPPTLRTYLPSESYGYVIDWVVAQVPELGLDLKEDMVVETTIDYELQGVAQRIVKDQMDRHGKEYDAGEAAAVIIDRNGAVKALVGGRDYTKNQYNHVTQAKRQPGSTFKPFVYLTALEKGLNPDTMVHDGPLRIGDWTPSNANDRFYGDVTMRDGLAKSLNTVAVRLSEWSGRDDVIKTAHRLGISSKLEPNASIALGTSEVTLLEMATAYVPFANGGFSAQPHIIRSVKDASGREVYKIGRTNWGRVIRPNNVAQMNDMLTGTIQYGTGNAGSIDPHPAAGKTGTSQSYRDAWFIGYTAYYVTGVWLGNDDSKPMKRVTGGSLPTLIWRDLMIYAHVNKEPAHLPGGEFFEARGNRPAGQGGRGESLWDALFGGTGSSARRDSTLGTPTASPARGAQRKSWLEDLFSN
ncbi:MULTISPECIES: PBP1A family penicillin-binding protein [Rhodomicrobium]|uniref:transglycosylase domain-containing protein n=1 Tax=Rhodomicrobium TaxID=1068 RepID=UPI000B4AB4C5|nr:MULTISPECIES: PBP1A family penicillin-binding protein [Rhodomicrobium]